MFYFLDSEKVWKILFLKVPFREYIFLFYQVRLDNIEEIWSPDLHIYHQKQFVKRDSTSIALRNNKNGYVDVSYVFEVLFVW